MSRNLHVITVIGLPLAGKTAFVTHIAALPRAASFHRRAGYRGFGGRQTGCLVDLSPLGHPTEASLLRTFSGAVWTPALWDLAMAESDGIIVVIDPQPAREADHIGFLQRFAERRS